ncbi:hypothetical protein HMPREF0083_04719 [Aneurinibacillus aneurinilyticus ATCC 12856]|uniref:Uncharacterized protein n=1 Tax=Aneurinibacillus aneurinilyticus ATCC 12856 TaxID=649747 RepID=U1WYB9_ANEAE|nr:hypothetical protein HMPREF0083_04719 [Aneurinibacillus aneurinilyticus ATCC 12856]
MKFTSSTILKAYIAFFFSFSLYGVYEFYIELASYTAMYPEDKKLEIINNTLYFFLVLMVCFFVLSIVLLLRFSIKGLKNKVLFVVFMGVGGPSFFIASISLAGNVIITFEIITFLSLSFYLWRRFVERRRA